MNEGLQGREGCGRGLWAAPEGLDGENELSVAPLKPGNGDCPVLPASDWLGTAAGGCVERLGRGTSPALSSAQGPRAEAVVQTPHRLCPAVGGCR